MDSEPPKREWKLLDLPSDVRDILIASLPQADQASLMCVSKALYNATFPHLFRMFCCVNCGKTLFPPSELLAVPTPRTPRSRRVFLQLRPRAPEAELAALSTSVSKGRGGDGVEVNAGGADEGRLDELVSLGLSVDARCGAANFHVLQHLARTMFATERFPLPAEMASVRALRCLGCGVFVGFRKGRAHFVHVDFLDLVNKRGRPCALTSGKLLQRDGLVRCAKCTSTLFEREDMLQWTHVLASTRLTDLDAYLEWDHSWAGPATAQQPAFFVKRLRPSSFTVGNVRVERCRQGPMEVGDVRCKKCEAHIGWKFLAECPAPGQRLTNYDQVGRFGIIRNSLTPSEPRSV